MGRRVAQALALMVGIGGCRDFERAAECLQVSEMTNAALSKVAALDSDGADAPPPDNYVGIAAIYQDLERQLTELEAKPLDAELVKAVTSLRAVLRVAAREAERYGELMLELQTVQGDDTEKAKLVRTRHNLNRSRERMSKNQRSYDAARDRIDRICALR